MQAMLRGESLGGMSEAAPSLVEHQGSLMMIEPGAAQQPDAWSQDIPAAMRTPSLEARQAGPLQRALNPASCRLQIIILAHVACVMQASSWSSSVYSCLEGVHLCVHGPDCSPLMHAGVALAC